MYTRTYPGGCLLTLVLSAHGFQRIPKVLCLYSSKLQITSQQLTVKSSKRQKVSLKIKKKSNENNEPYQALKSHKLIVVATRMICIMKVKYDKKVQF